jgi:Fe-S oxidoreductase
LLVAEHTMEAAQYLWHLHEGNRLSLDFSPVDLSVAYHHPCHLRVLDPEPVTTKLLSLVPGLQVQRIEAGCTGMAGTWGLQKKNYRNSLRIGWPLISAMRASTSTMATTGCGACRMQIEHGAAQATIHPIKLLAYAYGRMPKVQKEIEAAR